MAWFRFRKKQSATFDDDALAAQGTAWREQEHLQVERLATASEEEKQRALDERSADLRKNAANTAFLAEEGDPAEDEKMLADELRTMKRRNPAEYRATIAAMPSAERKMVEEVARRHGI